MKTLKEIEENTSMYSANGVHFPLDQYLRLIGKPTTSDIATVLLKWKSPYKKSRNPTESLQEEK